MIREIIETINESSKRTPRTGDIYYNGDSKANKIEVVSVDDKGKKAKVRLYSGEIKFIPYSILMNKWNLDSYLNESSDRKAIKYRGGELDASDEILDYAGMYDFYPERIGSYAQQLTAQKKNKTIKQKLKKLGVKEFTVADNTIKI